MKEIKKHLVLVGILPDLFLQGKEINVSVPADIGVDVGDVISVELVDKSKYFANVIEYTKPSGMNGTVVLQRRSNNP